MKRAPLALFLVALVVAVVWPLSSAIGAAQASSAVSRLDVRPAGCVPDGAATGLGRRALPPGHPPIAADGLPPGHPPVTGGLPPGHPPIGEGLPPGHPPVGGAAPGLPSGHPPVPAPTPLFGAPVLLDT